MKEYKKSWKYKNIDGILSIEFKITLNRKNITSQHLIYNIKKYDLRNYHINYNNGYTVFEFISLNIFFNIEHKVLIDEFLKYYSKYLKVSEDIKNKYIRKFKYISDIHKKDILKDKEVENSVKLYKDGAFMSKDSGKDITVDIDEFNLIKHVKNIINLLNNTAKYSKPYKAYRGINLNKEFNIGEIIFQRLPFSATIYPYVARDFIFESCCFLEIDIPEKYKGIFLNSLCIYHSEVILCPSKLTINKIIKIKKKNLYKYLNDEEFPFIKEMWYDVNYASDLIILKCSIEEIKINISKDKITYKEF